MGTSAVLQAGKSLSLHNRWQQLPFLSSHPNHELSVFVSVSVYTWVKHGDGGQKKGGIASHEGM